MSFFFKQELFQFKFQETKSLMGDSHGQGKTQAFILDTALRKKDKYFGKTALIIQNAIYSLQE